MDLASTIKNPPIISFSSTHYGHPRLSPLRSSIDHSFRLSSRERKLKLNLRRWEAKKVIRRINSSAVEIEDEACELVNGKEITIGELEDESNIINAYLFQAVKNNNGIGILLLSDVFGFEDSATRDFAYRLACNGYNVLVPDMFRGDPWAKNRPKEMFEQWRGKQNPERVAKDINTAKDWLYNEFVESKISKKLGLIGFCYGGGRVIEVLARDATSCFGTGVSFYGTRIDPTLASKVKVPILFVSGDNDELCPVSVLENLEKKLGLGSKVVIFKGRGHGFVHRPGSPDEDADAEKAFVLCRNWLQDGLV